MARRWRLGSAAVVGSVGGVASKGIWWVLWLTAALSGGGVVGLGAIVVGVRGRWLVRVAGEDHAIVAHGDIVEGAVVPYAVEEVRRAEDALGAVPLVVGLEAYEVEGWWDVGHDQVDRRDADMTTQSSRVAHVAIWTRVRGDGADGGGVTHRGSRSV